MNTDYHDILAELIAQNVRFLVVGAHALAVHGYPRATADIDLWIERTPENAARVWRALAEFGAPLADLRVRQEDLTRADVVVQLGLAPNRIDLLTGLSGLEFEHAWKNRIEEELEGVRVPILARSDLVKNKLASGRDKDRVDVQGLEGKS